MRRTGRAEKQFFRAVAGKIRIENEHTEVAEKSWE
jgi:hypothetical protein